MTPSSQPTGTTQEELRIILYLFIFKGYRCRRFKGPLPSAEGSSIRLFGGSLEGEAAHQKVALVHATLGTIDAHVLCKGGQ